MQWLLRLPISPEPSTIPSTNAGELLSYALSTSFLLARREIREAQPGIDPLLLSAFRNLEER